MRPDKTKTEGLYEMAGSELSKDIKVSVREAVTSTVMGTLIGGTFLIGFALTLGADDFSIGMLSSLPLLANLVQILGSAIIEKAGSRKNVCLRFLFFHRLMWTFIVILPLFVFRNNLTDVRVWIFLFFIAVSGVCASITGLAWTSWIADLVPGGIRGRFLAKRNMSAQFIGMTLAVLAGRFIDRWKLIYPQGRELSYGFAILFLVGVIFGFISILLFRKIREPAITKSKGEPFLNQLRGPFKDKDFFAFILFSVFWGFSTGIAGPSFSIYMIRTLSIPFSVITLFGVAAGIANIGGMKFWGGIIDKTGPKPLYTICATGGSLIPLFWIFAAEGSYSVLWLSNILTGIFWSGIGLASTGMMMNLAPKNNNSVYFAVFAAVTGLSGALAPIVGGAVGQALQETVLYDGAFNVSGLKVLFLLSSIMRLCSVFFIRKVELPDNADLKDMFSALNKLQKFLPAYTMQNFASSGLSYMENINQGMSRGVINMEEKLALLIERTGDMGKYVTGKIERADKKLDIGISRYENLIDLIIDKITGIFRKK